MLKFKYATACPVCGTQFKKTRSWHTYCSSRCRNKWLYDYIPKPVPEPKYADCLECNRQFEIKKPWQKYCCNNCRLISFHKRHSEETKEQIA